jgi:hypothetical protein
MLANTLPVPVHCALGARLAFTVVCYIKIASCRERLAGMLRDSLIARGRCYLHLGYVTMPASSSSEAAAGTMLLY